MHPIKGYSISTGYRKAGRLWSLGFHTGVDYAAPAGTPIYAVADGTIVSARWDNSFGNFQAVDHRVGRKTYRAYYCHQSRFRRTSGSVRKGEVLGYVGSTGNSTGNHLHFEVRVSPYTFSKGTIVNPSVLYNAGGGTASKNRMDPKSYFLGATGSHVTWLGQRLVMHGFGRFYSVGPGPNFTATDRNAVAAFQKAQGWTGSDADGLPGPETLKRLAAAPKSTAHGKAAKGRYTVLVDNLNGRSGPGTNYATVGNHPKKGQTFPTDRISGDWVRSASTKQWFAIRHSGQTLLKKVAAPAPAKPRSLSDYKPSDFGPGKKGAHVTLLGQRLVAHGYGKHYKVGPGPTWGEADRKNTADFQRAQGWSGSGADGLPGPETLKRLTAAPKKAPTKPKEPVDGTPKGGGPRPSPQVGSLILLPRSAWTDEPDMREEALDPDDVKAMTLHWPGDPRPSFADFDLSQIAELLRAWWKFHTEDRGWRDIGYNYSVDLAGRIWDLTGDDVGAHAGTVGNRESIGVVLVLGADDEPSPEMVAAVNSLFAVKTMKFPRMDEFQPHRQVPGNSTDCPGDRVVAAIDDGRFTA